MTADLDANKTLQAAYDRFLSEKDLSQKEEAGKELISAIFGPDAITEGRQAGLIVFEGCSLGLRYATVTSELKYTS